MSVTAEPKFPTRVHLMNWRQFDVVDVDLSQRLTIITGANGSGKTTLLTILAKHLAWQTRFASVPTHDENGRRIYVPDWRAGDEEDEEEDILRYVNQEDAKSIGFITYSDGSTSNMLVPPNQAESYDIALMPYGWFKVPGIYLTAFRTPTVYSKLEVIPAEFKTPAAMLEEVLKDVRKRHYSEEYINPKESAFRTMKQSLVAAAVFGPGNESVVKNVEAAAVWRRFQEVLRLLLPPELGFRRLLVQSPEVLIENHHGDRFSLDAVSGGVGAIVELAWQILLQSWGSSRFCVLMDEPENHLHPSLQRTLLPNLLKAFPAAWFVVASHSPFIVTSEPNAGVFALGFDPKGKVLSRRVEDSALAGSADATLREVLGIDTTRPAWAVDKLQAILNDYLSRPTSPENLRSLNSELRSAGLESDIGRAITMYLDSQPGTTEDN